jgi:hypothetical protein
MALFYGNGGPGPATKLLRVNVEGEGSDFAAWSAASGEHWTVARGWEPFPAQADIMFLGEFFMVEASEVPEIQQGMREQMARYGPLPAGHA